MKIRKKQLVFFSILILLMAGLNWPIAWFWMLNQPGPGRNFNISDDKSRQHWDLLMPDGKADSEVHVVGKADFIGYTRIRIQGGDTKATSLDDPRVRNLKIEWSGFPFASVWCYRRWDATAGTNELVGGFEITPRIMKPGTGNYGWVDSMPFMPLWGGMIANTIIYVAIVVLPFTHGPKLHRYLQRNARPQGMCPRCGYDVRATSGCPECGWGRV